MELQISHNTPQLKVHSHAAGNPFNRSGAPSSVASSEDCTTTSNYGPINGYGESFVSLGGGCATAAISTDDTTQAAVACETHDQHRNEATKVKHVDTGRISDKQKAVVVMLGKEGVTVSSASQISGACPQCIPNVSFVGVERRPSAADIASLSSVSSSASPIRIPTIAPCCQQEGVKPHIMSADTTNTSSNNNNNNNNGNNNTGMPRRSSWSSTSSLSTASPTASHHGHHHHHRHTNNSTNPAAVLLSYRGAEPVGEYTCPKWHATPCYAPPSTATAAPLPHTQHNNNSNNNNKSHSDLSLVNEPLSHVKEEGAATKGGAAADQHQQHQNVTDDTTRNSPPLHPHHHHRYTVSGILPCGIYRRFANIGHFAMANPYGNYPPPSSSSSSSAVSVVAAPSTSSSSAAVVVTKQDATKEAEKQLPPLTVVEAGPTAGPLSKADGSPLLLCTNAPPQIAKIHFVSRNATLESDAVVTASTVVSAAPNSANIPPASPPMVISTAKDCGVTSADLHHHKQACCPRHHEMTNFTSSSSPSSQSSPAADTHPSSSSLTPSPSTPSHSQIPTSYHGAVMCGVSSYAACRYEDHHHH